MRLQLLLFSIALAFLTSQVCGKTVFRRADKISDNFKQVNLAPEEIDPHVAPPAPAPQQLVETITPDEVPAVVGINDNIAPANEIIDEADEAAAAVVDEVADEAANEVEDVIAQATAGPAAAAATSAVVSVTTAAPITTTPVVNKDDPTGLSKYCKCTDSHCDCCRSIGLPILPVRSQGCAKITYLGNEKMSVSLKYGDITLATRTISGKRAKPICVGLPGGYSKFCGRIYGLSKAKENFKACLGFELRAEDEVEAALRVSCFKFGPGGLRVAEAEPLPSEVIKDEDEEDDDIFGFAAGGDDEDEDEDDYDADETDNEDDVDDEEDEDYADGEDTAAPDADYGGFSLGGLLEELADEDEETTTSNKPATAPVASAVTVASDTTRTAVASNKDMVQSKDSQGSEVTANVADAIVSAEEAAVTAVTTVAPTVIDATATTVKSKKSKKNKKKKASSDTDYAFELLNGILDFFN